MIWCSLSIENLRGNPTCSSEWIKAVYTTFPWMIKSSLLLTLSPTTKNVLQQGRSRVWKLLGIYIPHSSILQIRTTSGWYSETRSKLFSDIWGRWSCAEGMGKEHFSTQTQDHLDKSKYSGQGSSEDPFSTDKVAQGILPVMQYLFCEQNPILTDVKSENLLHGIQSPRKTHSPRNI